MKYLQYDLRVMPAEQYHADRAAIGHSGLVKVLRSPAHLKQYLENPPAPTQAKAFGHALHAALLEPAVFAEQYGLFDEARLEGVLQSLDDYKAAAAELGIKVGKLKKEEIKAAIQAADVESRFHFREDEIARLYDGKTILTPEQMTMIQGMIAAVRSHAGAALMLANGLAEMTCFWSDPETGILCKCRPD